MRSPNTHPARTRAGASNQTFLIAIAVSMLLVAAAILIARGTTSPTAPTSELDESEIPDITGPVGEVPDIREGGGLGPARDATVTLKDRNDPARTAWELEFAAFDPAQGEDLYDIDRPRAWYFVGANSAIYIRADQAQFVMADRFSEPESGRFEGNVELLQIDRAPDGSLPEPLPERSVVRITTEWLEFDAVTGELTTTEPVNIDSERIDAICEGMRIVLNEVDQQLEYFEVPGSVVATILPSSSAENQASSPAQEQGSSQPSPRADGNPASAATPDKPRREPEPSQFYIALFEGGVEIAQPNRNLMADRAMAWVELIGSRIPGDTFAQQDHPAPPVSVIPAGILSIERALLTAAIANIAQPETPDPESLGLNEPISFECAGPVTVRPMRDRPAALGGGDALAVRLEAIDDARVTFDDRGLLAEGDADWIEYGATTKLLTLGGDRDHPTRTTLEASGTLVAETVSLGLATGVGQALGAGLLSDPTGDRSVTWNDQADVVFRVENGWMTGSLEQAIASGAVRLQDSTTVVTAQDVNARFARGGSSAILERAVLAGDVRADTSRGTLSADRADIRFIVEGDRSTPHLAIATGNVRGEQEGRRITADQIEADLAPDAGAESDENSADGLRVTAARANGTVSYDRDDGTFAQGETVSVDALGKTVLVLGSPGTVGTRDAIVSGFRIELDDDNRSIAVPGRGTLDVRGEQGDRTIATASWTGSMTYSDATGALAADGAIEIVSTPEPLQRDTLRGDRIEAVLEAIPEGDGEDNVQLIGERRGGSDLGGGRRLVAAVVEQTESDQPASAELLRFSEIDGGPESEPTRLTLLTGRTIRADDAAGVLTVPGAGRLLLADRRPPETASAQDENASRGSALFDWEGSMRFDRREGQAAMDRRVRMVHRPLADDRASVELEAERLTAGFLGDASARLTSPLAEAENEAAIETVLARGAVWARSGAQQMLADALDYDPATGVANASAADGGWVTIFDPNQGGPVTAEQLLWSLDTGRVEVVRPSPVTAPR